MEKEGHFLEEKSRRGARLVFRGYLPHFDIEGKTQTMTFRLFDSMPQAVLDLWRQELISLPKREQDLERRKRIDAYLDQGHGSCYLKDDRLAEIVQSALLHFDVERYALHAWVVMPNHVGGSPTGQPRWGAGSHTVYPASGMDAE